MSIFSIILRYITKVTTPLSFRRGVGGEAVVAVAAFVFLLLLAACQQDDTQCPSGGDKGRIVLSFSDVAAYVDVTTRAEQPLENISDYDFTLSGTTAGGESVEDVPLSVTDGIAVVDAGTYSIAVRGNSTLEAAAVSDLGTPYYEGSSVDANNNPVNFTVEVGGTTPVKVLLKPTNAQLIINLSTSFTSKYRNVTLAVGSRVVALLTDATVPTTDTQVTAYFPVGYLTVSATARADSHVTEIIPLTNAINLERGTSNTLNLAADPVTGEIIPIAEGVYTGEFD